MYIYIYELVSQGLQGLQGRKSCVRTPSRGGDGSCGGTRWSLPGRPTVRGPARG